MNLNFNKENYFILKIPFQTKAEIRSFNIEEHMRTKGFVYYIFDRKLNKFIDEYLQLENSNFRTTDLRIKKPTKYYKRKEVKEFRDKYLDPISPIESLNVDEYKKIDLTKIQLEEINKYFKNKSKLTVRTMFSLLSGSNPTGAELNNYAPPLLCSEIEYWECNFLNVVKRFFCEKKLCKNINIRNLDLKEYSIKDLINNNIVNNFKEVFFEYNEEFLYKENIDLEMFVEEKQITNNNLIINSKFEIEEKQKDFLYAISKINDYEIDKVKSTLRRFFASNVKKYIKENKIPLHSTIKKFNLKVIENAHIIKFSDLTKDLKNYNALKDAISPFNCLRIDSNVHALFDKKQIKFDDLGNILNLCDKKQEYLDMENMPKETYKFFKQYLEEYNN